MKQILIGLVLALTLSSCAPTVQQAPQLTPAARHAYSLTHLIDEIGILQVAAEDGVRQHVLTVKEGDAIVQSCVAMLITIKQVPNGWYPAAYSAFRNAKAQLSPTDLAKFKPYLDVFEVILQSFESEPA